MILKIALIAAMLAAPLLVHGADELAEAKAKYNHAKPASGEAARLDYVHELIRMHDKLMLIDKGPQWTDAVEARFRAINDEMKQHSAPSDSNSKALSKMLSGKWRSPRHDYSYKSNGTWIMLPVGEGGSSPHGIWTIKGNLFTTDGKNEYTIILLDAHDFVYTDNDGDVFYEKRILK